MASYLDKILSTKIEVVKKQKSLLNIDEIKSRLDVILPAKGFISCIKAVSYTHLRANETGRNGVSRGMR